MERLRKDAWEQSYAKHQNYVFYPNEEVIRFVSQFIRKRIGLDDFEDAVQNAAGMKVLDAGCGIGRHVKYCREMGFDAYGIDFSAEAIRIARLWLRREGMQNVDTQILEQDARTLPFTSGFFDHALSHGVLDSMTFEVAQQVVMEVHRVLKPAGYFYCDLISGDASGLPPDFEGEQVISGQHEQGTIQSYFGSTKIDKLFAQMFVLKQCILVRRENRLRDTHTGRWHLVLQRI